MTRGYNCFSFALCLLISVLKSLDYNSNQTENSSKQFQTIKTEQKTNDSDSNKTNSHSCRHCTSPCLHRSNPPFLPIPSLLSSSASSSSNSSSSPSSPSQIYLKPHSTIQCNGNDETKFPSPSSSTIIAAKDNLPLGNSLLSTTYPSITTSSCSTMVTPTASLLSSVTATTALTPSSLFPGHQLSSVQCTKLHCPPTSSWSPPLSSSSNLATTSTDNRTVIKTNTESSPKSSSSPTILMPSACPPVITTNTATVSNNNNSLLDPLDTNYVANVVRKLLAQHNIGQRIFARYILSLSQGTVSELLSKPKSWAKLTEKGKESYRKMWCWANSEESILALKSISPRKGMNNRSKDNPYPAVSTKHTDPATHQKIVQILADAQKQQMAAAVAAAAAAANMDQKSSLSPCSSLPNDPSNPMPSSDPLESKSPLSSSQSTDSSAANSPLNESTSIDQKSFLLPIPPPPPPSSSSTAASLSMLSAFVPSLLMRTANGFNSDSTSNPTITGNLIDCSNTSPFNLLCHQPDNYRNWLMLQEIVRNNDLLKQFQPTFPPIQPIITEREHESEEENDDDSRSGNDDDDDNDDDRDEDDDDDDMNDNNPTSSDEIPLDLSMKLDANQMNDIDQTSTSISNGKSHSLSSSTKHVKTALTPLREQDISKYRYVNTMELVQTVKDILSRYSISQRHFGEKILGLSQGSVSDILARPKQWELLTQKGREPFLRMRIFLDDPNAIKQLVQTVSTTATTANTNPILLPTFCPPLPPTSLPSSLLTTPSLLSNGFHTNNLLTRENSIDSQTNILLNDSTSIGGTNDTIQSNSSVTSPTNGLITNSNKSKSRSKNSKLSNDKSTNQSRSSSTNPLMAPYELPKITLPSSIDTEQLSSQVRELLFAYSIGQRVFGEAVLNLSQGTVSEILSKPRPWHSLSVKGREPYIRMYTWYNDTGNVQKLLAWKRERDALRRSRPPISTPSNIDNGESENPNALVENSSTSTNTPKRRYLFNDEQRRILKQTFQNEPYPCQSTLEKLVNELSLPMNKIANWFHNSRMRTKTNIRPNSSPTNLISSSLISNNDQISDDDDDLDDNNNTNNINNDEDDDDDDDDYPIVPTIVPLTSSWLNGTNDSNSSTSPNPYFSTPTNIVSLIDEHKTTPQASSSSSKKRKSVPQKIITNTNHFSSKKFHSNDSPPSQSELDTHEQTTNESAANFVDILT